MNCKRCKAHPSNFISFYCSNPTCLEVFCKACQDRHQQEHPDDLISLTKLKSETFKVLQNEAVFKLNYSLQILLDSQKLDTLFFTFLQKFIQHNSIEGLDQDDIVEYLSNDLSLRCFAQNPYTNFSGKLLKPNESLFNIKIPEQMENKMTVREELLISGQFYLESDDSDRIPCKSKEYKMDGEDDWDHWKAKETQNCLKLNPVFPFASKKFQILKMEDRKDYIFYHDALDLVCLVSENTRRYYEAPEDLVSLPLVTINKKSYLVVATSSEFQLCDIFDESNSIKLIPSDKNGLNKFKNGLKVFHLPIIERFPLQNPSFLISNEKDTIIVASAEGEIKLLALEIEEQDKFCLMEYFSVKEENNPLKGIKADFSRNILFVNGRKMSAYKIGRQEGLKKIFTCTEQVTSLQLEEERGFLMINDCQFYKYSNNQPQFLRKFSAFSQSLLTNKGIIFRKENKLSFCSYQHLTELIEIPLPKDEEALDAAKDVPDDQIDYAFKRQTTYEGASSFDEPIIHSVQFLKDRNKTLLYLCLSNFHTRRIQVIYDKHDMDDFAIYTEVETQRIISL